MDPKDTAKDLKPDATQDMLPPPAEKPTPIRRTQAVSLGRIVHYNRDGTLQAAIVTRVREVGLVDLAIFPPHGGGPQGAQNVVQGTDVGTWCWPKIEG